jgi:SAM-dependent methyltransferase
MMTPEAKQELRQQLQTPEAVEALGWVQTGGWYPCAYENEPCKCYGQVRYGASHVQQWSEAKTVTSGSIICSKDIFGDPAPGQNKQCGCHKSVFSLTKNENSASYLQESWIFMLRFLARLKMLPFTGDRRYHGLELWSARHGGVTGGTLERYWIEKYIVEQYQNIPGGNCLEWGLYYVTWLSQCTNNYENKYEAVKYGQKQPSVEGNIVYASIYDFPSVIGGAGIQFNFICATELFEHLEKPYEAASDLYRILAPGGAVLFTVPQQAQYHKVPQDFLRYTKEGVKHVMEIAGFCVPPQLMAGSGDFIFDVARNTGLQIQDFTMEELDEGYQRGYDSIADGAITIHAMAYKPPHAFCR